MSPLAVPVTNFGAYLDQYPKIFRDCDVISVTHSKNLDSPVLHEYLHLIIRHRPSNAWRRLLVERQTHQDQVIIGLWPWVTRQGSGRSSGAQLPLPLLMRNLRFVSLNLQTVAKILLYVHRQRPEYHVVTANCFWYADAVFEILRNAGQSAGNYRYHQWPYLKLRGVAVIANPRVKGDLRVAAGRFQNLLPNTPFRGEIQDAGGKDQDAGGEGEDMDMYDVFPRALQVTGDTATPTDFDVSIIEAEENEVSQCIIKAMKEVDLISNLDELAIRRLTEERKADIIAFSNAVLASPEKQADLGHDEEVQRGQESEDSDFIAQLVAAVAKMGSENALSEREEARYEEAIRVFAASVLKEVSN
ncbi:hypothetical protein H0H81_001122 [Sphagnurus paluster]|uniref:Uncharacterized protein n=1 Tax=Sphagnurus paluster TaxID=117069 RepID=A0A9P7FMK0_9AGAR|nr:hypothetical protein H0H81_001122 [Sphagnurus paluster]